MEGLGGNMRFKKYVELKNDEVAKEESKVLGHGIIDIYGYDKEVVVWEDCRPTTYRTPNFEIAKGIVDTVVKQYEKIGYKIINDEERTDDNESKD